MLPKIVFWQPQNMMIDPTNNCNLHCIMCRTQKLKQNTISWSYLDFLYATKSFSPRSISLGATGEPLLNNHIKSMINNLHKRRIKVTLNTNGTLLQKLGDDWLHQLSLIKISIDSPSEETYTIIRQNKNFQQLLDTIKKISFFKKPKIRLEYVVMSTNYHEMPNFIKLCKTLNVSCFFRLFEGLQQPSQTIEKLANVPEIGEELYKALLVADALNVQTNLRNLCRKLPYIKQYYLRNPIIDDRRKHICLLPWLQLFIRVDGETSPCCNLLENGKYSTGNIFQTHDIWNSQTMQNLREIFLQKKNYDLFAPCSRCEYMDWKQLISWTRLIPGWFK